VTLLELAQALHSEVGAEGTAPSSVSGARGEWKRLVNVVIRSDIEIQAMYENWKFLRNEFSQTTSDGVATLAAPASIRMWDFDTFKIREAGDSAGDEYPIEAVEYDQIKGEVLDVTEGVPTRVIVMPDNSLKFEPVPDGAHRILADYYVHPTRMSANGDTSTIPAAYHDAILGKAIRKYANFEGANEISQEAMDMWELWLPRLENNQLPNQQHSRFRTGARIEVIGSQ
jgi:hypothetical protein